MVKVSLEYEKKPLSDNKFGHKYIEEVFTVKIVQILGNPQDYFALLTDNGTIIRGCWLGDMAYDNPVPKVKLPLNVLIRIKFMKNLDGVGFRQILSVEKVNR